MAACVDILGLCLFGLVLVFPWGAIAADEDPLQDVCVADLNAQLKVNGFPCKASVSASDFVSPMLRQAGNTNNKLGSNVTAAGAANFPGLNTQGLSFARIDYAPGGVVPPHIHPRATEVLFVVSGTLRVGFVTSSPDFTLFTNTLYPGDLTVFPRALVHFIINVGDTQALSLSGLDSQNPGASLLPNVLFASNPTIGDDVLDKAFNLPESEIEKIKAAVKG
ncbi:hypothetical protein O6H91_07G117300 [Diphasiastrum complanatum]|uniref:Uncharacterized protein n=2 Tax=Diphasiastrum complanatum TaxID=34168 RepID=A0ACC2D9D5_DIPCM|nr:hypothetical protein O6H91_07G116000 [Diphasiastrum complanatum]KAJ7550764.1 hypothetical protein O6H91_07G117300 [Diphasiastrum complanatum]